MDDRLELLVSWPSRLSTAARKSLLLRRSQYAIRISVGLVAAACLVACGADGVQRAGPSATLPFCPAQQWLLFDLGPYPCPTAEEFRQLNEDFDITFGADPTTPLACRADQGSIDLTVLQAKTYLPLKFIRSLTLLEPLPWTSLQPYRLAARGRAAYLHRIQRQEVGRDGGSCHPPDAP